MYDYDLDYKEQPTEPMTADDQAATDLEAQTANEEAWDAARQERMCEECKKIPAYPSYKKCAYCMNFICKKGHDPKNPGTSGCGRQAGKSGYCYKHAPVTARSVSSAYYDRYN